MFKYVRFVCLSGFTYYAPGQCLRREKGLTEVVCEASERGISSPGSPSTAHPVSIATGTKTWAEQDYSSEDGLLTVNRKYRSRMRGGARLSFKEPDRFGSHWQGMIPGPLVFSSSTDSEVEYLSDCGGIYAFVSTVDPADVSFNANSAKSSEHRLKLEISAPIPDGMGRKDFIETAPVSAPGTGEFRLELPNGDYTLYRRPTVDANDVGLRTAVASLLREGVRARKNILISGGTSSGKTTFANALVKEIPDKERLIFIEDTPELDIDHANAVGLLAARSELSEARVNADDLLTASLRMRPDRIILGEVRGPEAFTFLRAINTGHPGSLTTIHADSPAHAIDQLALLVLQSGARLAWNDVVRYVRSTIDIYVQLERRNGKRGVAAMATRETLIYDERQCIS